LPIPDAEEAPLKSFQPTPAAPDVPAAVGGIIVAVYATLLGAFALATVASAYSAFMVAIAALFMVAFFAVPRLFLAQEPGGGARPSLEAFMDKGMDTLTGHSKGRDALIQMIIVPVFLTIDVVAIAITAAIYL
jgi:hypothetical protein